MIYILILLLVTIVNCDDAIPTDPYTEGAKLLVESLKHSEGNYVSEIMDSDGFRDIDNKMAYSTGSIRSSDDSLIKLVDSIIKNTVFEQLSLDAKNAIHNTFNELKLQVITSRGSEMKNFGITYNGNDGQIYVLLIKLKKNNEDVNVIDYEKCIILTDFIPAPSTVKRSRLYENMIRSDYEEWYEEVPTGVKNAHFATIMRWNQEIMSGLSNGQNAINNK
jgi:hypothetical protein